MGCASMDLLELKCTSISTVLYNFLRKVLLKCYIKLYVVTLRVAMGDLK